MIDCDTTDMFAESAVPSRSRSLNTREAQKWPTCLPSSSRRWVWFSLLPQTSRLYYFLRNIWWAHCFKYDVWCCSGKGTRSTSSKCNLRSRTHGQWVCKSYLVVLYSIVLVWLDSNSNTPCLQITPTSIQCDNAQQKLDTLPPPFLWAEVDHVIYWSTHNGIFSV